jgi:hypothetical protein
MIPMKRYDRAHTSIRSTRAAIVRGDRGGVETDIAEAPSVVVDVARAPGVPGSLRRMKYIRAVPRRRCFR